VSRARVEGTDLTDLDGFAAGFPHDVFARLRRDTPVAWHEPTAHTPGGEGFWVVTRHADCHAAATDAATFSSETGPGRAGAGGTLIEDLPAGLSGALLNMMDDPRHKHIRTLVTPAVAPRALAAIEPVLAARTEAILDGLTARGECDFLVDVAMELPLQATCLLMGVPEADRHQLIEWANVTFDYDDRELGQASPRTEAASAGLFAYGTQLLAAKRDDPGDDILSAVVHARVPGPGGEPEPLTDIELLMFFNLLIAAGSETTRNAIALGLAALVDHPDQLDALRADRSLLPGAVEEILRWSSVTPYNRRTATREVDLAGQVIAPGEKVTLWWASANRDEAVFASPDRFDIRRDPNPHLAFGHGAHFCLGAALARREIRIVLDAVLDRWVDIELAGPIEWTRSNKHTGVRHMPVRFHERDGTPRPGAPRVGA
jgi:cytochrome P450